MRLTTNLGAALLMLSSAHLIFGCSSDDKSPGKAADDDNPHVVDYECKEVVSEKDCDTSLPPVVYVHGTAASGENIAHIAQLFGSNGYCQERFVAIDYNSIGGLLGLGGGSGPNQAVMDEIDALVDKVRSETGHDKVFLMGHSQGTRHCIDYLSDPARAAKVEKYVHYSGAGTIPDGVKALSISSENDLGGAPIHPAGAEREVTFTDEDHYSLAANTASFVETWKYLFGSDPERTEIACGDETIVLEGYALTFGESQPRAGETLEIYELGAEPWARGEPLMTLTAGEDGHIGPIELKRLTAYELRNGQVGAFYLFPQRRSNYLVRGLVPSENPLIASLTTDQVARDPGHSAIVFRALSGAMRKDLGHSLKIDGEEVLTDDNAGRETITAVLFVYDDGVDQRSTHRNPWTLPIPFIFATDFFIDASEPRWIEIDWNGDKLYVPNLPSDSMLMSVLLP